MIDVDALRRGVLHLRNGIWEVQEEDWEIPTGDFDFLMGNERHQLAERLAQYASRGFTRVYYAAEGEELYLALRP